MLNFRSALAVLPVAKSNKYDTKYKANVSMRVNNIKNYDNSYIENKNKTEKAFIPSC